jgi:uncharacterized protein YndB with AHSA1/START domain
VTATTDEFDGAVTSLLQYLLAREESTASTASTNTPGEEGHVMVSAELPSFTHDPECDLFLERLVDVPVELVWRAWTEPEHLKAWFAPQPWTTVECDIDLRPGGVFRTVMQAPDGTVFDEDTGGCYLEVVSPHRLVWTSALGPGYRPRPVSTTPTPGEFQFTAELTFEAVGDATRYSVRAIHATAEAAVAHEELGFSGGWSVALDQLVTHMTEASGR